MSLKLNLFEDEFSSPIDMSDVLEICLEYSKAGPKIQNQINMIWEEGLDYSLDLIEKENIPFIINFFNKISNNPLFGDASSQAKDVVEKLNLYSKKYTTTKFN